MRKGKMSMNDNILKDILFEVHTIECGIIDGLPDCKPSLRHRLAMKRIFARFDRNTRKLRNAEAPTTERRTKKYSIRQRILIAMLIIILAAFLAGCVNAIVKFVSARFYGEVYKDNTQLFAYDLENCPDMIEEQYVLTNVPEGFELIETVPSPISMPLAISIYMRYFNNSTGQDIIFIQWVKEAFDPHYSTEKNSFEEIEINGTTGLYIDFSTEDKNYSTIIWDNGDYIIEIAGAFDKNGIIDLADITKL